MRELKFRAWDKENECWLNFGYASIYRKEDGEPDTIFKFDFSDSYIVEQYTGLKDKNRKEIYVGDIVSEHNGDIIGEIIQKPSGEYCIAWIGIYGGSSVLYDELSMCEVIGNIHENPELLGGKE